MNALLQEALSVTPAHGEAAFWWLGQIGYLIRLGNLTLCIDPYFDEDPERLYPSPILPEEMQGVDYVLGTHDHIDHIDREGWRRIAKACPETRFVAPSVHIPSLSSQLDIPLERFVGINEGTRTFSENGLNIYGIAAAHEFFEQDEKTGEYPHTSYVIEANGVRIFHSGDALMYEGLVSKIRQYGPIDLMFVPINGRDAKRFRSGCAGNMTFQEAVDLTGEIRPRLAVPGHYDMFAFNLGNPQDYAEYLEAKFPGIPYWIGNRSTRVDYPQR